MNGFRFFPRLELPVGLGVLKCCGCMDSFMWYTCMIFIVSAKWKSNLNIATYVHRVNWAATSIHLANERGKWTRPEHVWISSFPANWIEDGDLTWLDGVIQILKRLGPNKHICTWGSVTLQMKNGFEYTKRNGRRLFILRPKEDVGHADTRGCTEISMLHVWHTSMMDLFFHVWTCRSMENSFNDNLVRKHFAAIISSFICRMNYQPVHLPAAQALACRTSKKKNRRPFSWTHILKSSGKSKTCMFFSAPLEHIFSFLSQTAGFQCITITGRLSSISFPMFAEESVFCFCQDRHGQTEVAYTATCLT